MLYSTEPIDAYDRQLLVTFANAVQRSPQLNETQKRVIERLLQQVVYTWTSKDFM